jgi:hypothetical protein
MALPKLQVPRYELKLPSDGRRIKYRPFLVKEEKLLLLAMETQDQQNMVDTIKDLIVNTTNLSMPDVDNLPTFDIEYLFLQIRSKSVGESVDLMMTCPDDMETQVAVTVDLSQVEVKRNPKHSNTIKLDKTISMVMKYPKMDTFVSANFETGDQLDNVFEVTISCIDQIIDGEEVYDAKESSREELQEFLEQFDSKQFEQIQTFFETMPKLSHEIKFMNPNTKVEQTYVLEGLASFFG